MTDDIQLVELSAVIEPTDDDHERADEPSDSDSSSSRRRRLLWVALGVTAAVLLGLGVVAVVAPESVEAAIAPNLGLSGLMPGFRPRLRALRRAVRRVVPFRATRDEPPDRQPEGAPSLDGADDADDANAETNPDGSDLSDADDARGASDPPSISVSRLSDERDVSVIVDHLMRAADSRPLPDAFGVVSPIKRPLASTLEGIPQELGVHCRDVSPVLVGTANNETTVERLGRTYELLLVVTPDHEAVLSDVLRYLPALIRTDGVAGVGSVRTVTLPATERPGTERESQGTLKALRGHKGEPRHPMARTEPDFIAASAPSEWTGPVRSVLSDYAPVIEVVEWDRPAIHVAGFVFASAVDLPDHVTASGDDSPGHAPSGDSSSSGADGRPTGSGGSTPTRSSAPADESTPTSPPDSDGPPSTDSSPESSGEDPPQSPDTDEKAMPRDGTTPQTTPDGGRASGGSTLPRSSQSPPQTGGDAPEEEAPRTGAEPDDSTTGAKPDQDGPNRTNRGSDPTPEKDDSSPDAGSSGADSDDDQSDAEGERDTRGAEADGSGDGAGGAGGALDAGDDAPSSESAASDDANAPASTPSGPPNESAQPTSGSDDSAPASDSAEATPESRPAAPESGANRSSSDGAPSGRGPSGGGESQTAPEPETTLPAEFPVPAGTTPDDGAGSPPSSGGSKSPSPEPTPTRPEGSSASPSSTPETPADDIDAGAGIVPFGDAPASSDPSVVDVTEHVLNELTFQATATPGREVYSTVYADERGLIRHHHAIDHPDFLRSRTDSISFTSEFFSHLRRLASLHKDIDHRLAGGAHSHPVSGQPLQSGADKRFVRKVWRNTRNTSFIVGVTEGEGPDEWTITDDGREVRRQSNDHLVRIRAFSGRNEPKRIRLHQNMGQ
ncbi:hypothetical protein C5B86_11985 [Haloferax sp. Atlit-19N]|uniref:hypothetical protein n=1 Tax=Haloferax sp. Atlit-19N TaxID=2077201 RepID=UPI000E27FD3C|nr:hypothetical protein [Haloferax sp. Atlit-19N]RDZ43746.1 hypothetical protein C5B86_11985 [Haloferax sp. Atlit-19N]